MEVSLLQRREEPYAFASSVGFEFELRHLNEKDWASLMAQMVKNLPAIQEMGFDSWIGKIPWRREWLPTLVFWPGECHGQRSLGGYSPWDCKESNVTE